jgi:hypothetical protein
MLKLENKLVEVEINGTVHKLKKFSVAQGEALEAASREAPETAHKAVLDLLVSAGLPREVLGELDVDLLEPLITALGAGAKKA